MMGLKHNNRQMPANRFERTRSDATHVSLADKQQNTMKQTREKKAQTSEITLEQKPK